MSANAIRWRLLIPRSNKSRTNTKYFKSREKIMRKLSWIFAFAMPMMALMLTVVPMMEQPVVAGQPTAVEIKIDNFSFTPPTITVKAGTEVTWTNKDDIPHNVVSEDKTFKSKVLDTDEKFTYTASKPGTYTYYCSIHPKMTGKLVVEQ